MSRYNQYLSCHGINLKNKTDDFGWDGTGLRGYVFSNKERSIVIVAFKGTSTLFGGGDTVAEDKYIVIS